MRRAQSTIELLVLLGVAMALTTVVAVVAGADGGAVRRHLVESIPGHRPERRDDRWALRSDAYGPLIRRYVPTLILERDRYGEDAAVPSDPGVCRKPWCAALGTGRPTIFTHVVRKAATTSGAVGGAVAVGAVAASGAVGEAGGVGGERMRSGSGGVTYIQYWFYYPDSKTLHAPVPAWQGYHRDDWEGLIVRIPDDGEPAARVTAHQGLVGSARGWTAGGGGVTLAADPGWRPIAEHPTIHRAAGSHANGFTRDGIDMPLDRWNGDLGTIPWQRFTLVAADTAPALRFRYDPAATPPWMKALWTNPEAVGTGRPQSKSAHHQHPIGQAQSRAARIPRVDVTTARMWCPPVERTHSSQHRRRGWTPHPRGCHVHPDAASRLGRPE